MFSPSKIKLESVQIEGTAPRQLQPTKVVCFPHGLTVALGLGLFFLYLMFYTLHIIYLCSIVISCIRYIGRINIFPFYNMLIVPEFKELSPVWPSEQFEIKHLHAMTAAENTI